MVRPPSKGRCRIEMALRPVKSSRQVTFSKCRGTLFRSCSDLALDFRGDRAAVVVFSEAGKVFALGCPSVDAVLDDDNAAEDEDREALEELRRARKAVAKQVADEVERMKAIVDKVVEAQAGKRFWWEVDPNALGEAELPEFARAFQRLKDNLRHHADKLARRPRAPAPATAAVAHAGF